MVLQGSESDWCPPYLKSDVLGTTVIQIILGLILELLNRQKSVSAAKRESYFTKMVQNTVIFFVCYSSYAHMFVQCTHRSYGSQLCFFSFLRH